VIEEGFNARRPQNERSAGEPNCSGSATINPKPTASPDGRGRLFAFHVGDQAGGDVLDALANLLVDLAEEVDETAKNPGASVSHPGFVSGPDGPAGRIGR